MHQKTLVEDTLSSCRFREAQLKIAYATRSSFSKCTEDKNSRSFACHFCHLFSRFIFVRHFFLVRICFRVYSFTSSFYYYDYYICQCFRSCFAPCVYFGCCLLKHSSFTCHIFVFQSNIVFYIKFFFSYSLPLWFFASFSSVFAVIFSLFISAVSSGLISVAFVVCSMVGEIRRIFVADACAIVCTM